MYSVVPNRPAISEFFSPEATRTATVNWRGVSKSIKLRVRPNFEDSSTNELRSANVQSRNTLSDCKGGVADVNSECQVPLRDGLKAIQSNRDHTCDCVSANRAGRAAYTPGRLTDGAGCFQRSRATAAMAQSIENQFNAIAHSQLVIDVKQTFLNGILFNA